MNKIKEMCRSMLGGLTAFFFVRIFADLGRSYALNTLTIQPFNIFGFLIFATLCYLAYSRWDLFGLTK